MAETKKPEALEDGDLDEAQGGGVFGTPSGGWGVAGSAEPNEVVKAEDPTGRKLAHDGGRIVASGGSSGI
jgi:hypothetical protein